MHKTVLLIIICITFLTVCCQNVKTNYDFAIAIHGGAGNISTEMPDSIRDLYLNAIDSALMIGQQILENGGTSKDAVVKTIIFMENHPLFNAGRGAVITRKGTIEHDASIMDGKTLNAGAIAGVRHIKNPIILANEVMKDGENVLLACSGAEEFAKKKGIELIDTGYFYTSGRLKQYQDTKIKGTVGCVAIDKQGNLCAGTSTGGRANKEHGRIGDSPIIGAGTYADNSTCAVSCTGHGEFFIRYCVAHDISALMKYKGLALQQAANHVIQDKLEKANGTGGIIAIDTMGNIAFSFNTTAMFRGYIDKDGEKVTAIF